MVASRAHPAAADKQDGGTRIVMMRRGDPALSRPGMSNPVTPDLAKSDHAVSDSQWDRLARNCSTPNPFFERWALTAALDAFDTGGNVQIVCAYEGAELIGLLPLVHSGDYYGYPVPHYRTWLHANAFCGAPLVARGHERAFWTALLDWADRASASALFLHLSGLPEDGALYTALAALTRPAGRPSAVVMREERALLHSSLSADAYFEQSMSAKKRKELRRQSRRLAEEGNLQFQRQSDTSAIEDWASDFLVLEAKGWKGDEGSALSSAPDTDRFFRACLGRAAAAGRLERLTLTLDGRPIAMLANLVTEPGIFSFKTAYDEDYARFSPGVLLQRENLDLLDRPDIEWCDSCASEGHPMIERIWREKRTILRVSIGIGGMLRRQAARAFLTAETRTLPKGL